LNKKCILIKGSGCGFKVELNVHHRSLPRRLVLFVLIQKWTKKIKSAEMLLCAQAFHAQSSKSCGLESFRRATLSLPYPVSEKFLCPARHTGRQLFSLLPEAYLLTVSENSFSLVRVLTLFQPPKRLCAAAEAKAARGRTLLTFGLSRLDLTIPLHFPIPSATLLL